MQLNSLPPQAGRRYLHVREWIADINARRRSDPEFEAGVAIDRDDRLLMGGMKNLLSGVTTVAHHDPFYPLLSQAHFPTDVLRDYGWSHSLYIDGEEKVRNAYEETPKDRPWIIHAAEGIDPESGGEFDRLDALGCLRENSLLVHGVALDRAQRTRLDRASAGLIWCPSSNFRLFGRTADVAELVGVRRVALGTDSRMSGSRDLLDELRFARRLGIVDDGALESMVTRDGARLLRLPDRGELRADARADILVLPAGTRLVDAARADIRLVMINGAVLYGDRDFSRYVGHPSIWTDIVVDGRPKFLDRRIAERIARSKARETGLQITQAAGKAA